MEIGARTLEELERDIWPDPAFASATVRRCHEVRRKPLALLTVEDLRLMIGQGIGLRWLLPRALGRLDENPLAEGDFFPGDLLVAVLRAVTAAGAGDRATQARLGAICRDALARAEPTPTADLRREIDAFLAR